MKKVSFFKRALAVAVASTMLLSFDVPGFAMDNATGEGLKFEQVDNSVIQSSILLDNAVVKDNSVSDYDDNDVVRVSVVLKEDSVIDAGYDTEDILENSAALAHLTKVKNNQKKVEKKLAKAAKKGMTVKQNLAITSNIISADVKYGDIKNLESVSEVKEVIIETQYLPCDAVNVAGPQMAVSTRGMTGAAQSWAEGYKGAGARIAIIDTGLDIDHQSFDNDAFMYALKQDAPKVTVTTNKNNNNKNKDKDKKNNKKEEVVEEVKYDLSALNLLGVDEIAEALPYLNAYAAVGGKLTAKDVVISDKIPFGFNYVDVNLNVRHIYDAQGEHGSHVAGISAANRFLKTEEGKFVDAIKEVGVAGNAPDAQVLVMKVFGQGGGAYDSDYMAAIEDAIVLGCDAVNLSLGSSSAGLATSGQYQAILDKLEETSTVVVMSAGNSGAWADMTTYGDLYADGVNFDTAGSPGSFTNSLGVASVDNAGSFGYSFSVAGKKYGYSESATYGNAPLVSLVNGETTDYDYVFIEGVGVEEDYEGIDANGKVVFVSRGSTSFYEKANIAVEHGAIATIIYNNQPGTIGLNLTGYSYTAPCVSIKQDEAQVIKSASTPVGNYFTGKITLSSEMGVVESDDDYYTMSSFSSWGVPGNLSMKPEITAPGGSIWSVFGLTNEGGGHDQYELMSGTSMAAPQITGMTAVLKRYIELNSLSVKKVSGLTDRALAQSLLMSTATPLKDANGNYYSVLKQGAGLANVNDAMHADSFILMNDDATVSAHDGKVKVELGDDPARTGAYTFSFNINNFSNSHVTYKLNADVFTQATDGDFLYGDTMSVPATVSFTVNGKKVDSVKVNKKKSATVNVEIKLADETKAFLDAYTKGAYVEAYVFAEATNGSTSHSIPVLGFYGNWTDPSMFDLGSYIDYAYGLEDRYPYLLTAKVSNPNATLEEIVDEYMDKYCNAYTVNFADGSGDYYFGGNLYASEYEYHPEFASLNNQNGDMISSVRYSLIRNAGNIATVITDKNTGEVYLNKNVGSQYGAYYYTNGATWRNTSNKIGINWAGTDAKGNKLPEGTEVEISFVAVPEYYIDSEGNYNITKLGDGAFFSTSLTIDNTAPMMVAVADGESGSLEVTAIDNVGIAAIELYSKNGRNKVGSVSVGDTEVYGMLGQGLSDDIYLVVVIDYAGNMSTYKVFMNVDVTDNVESVELDETDIVLMKNSSTKLTATVNPANVSDDTVTWTSSDETVAVVNEDGVVKAVGLGECVITAASTLNPAMTASCAVTVIEINTELNGVVWDEEGQVWFSQFNTANLPNYTKLTESSYKAPVNGMAYGADGTLYATDIDTGNQVSNLYTVDDNFGLNLVGTSVIAYTDVADAPHLTGLIGTYFNYIVLIDPETGNYAGAFNYLPSGELVGITYEGSMFHSSYGQYIDMYLLLDSDGNLYEEAFINLGGSYYYFLGAEDALLGGTGITCDVPYFQSLYFNGEYTFASSFNESKNSVTLYAIDVLNTGAVYALGEFADGVWPVAALCDVTTYDVQSANVAKFAEAVVNEDAVMSTVVEKHELKAINK